MVEISLILVFNALFIFGVKVLFEEGNLLGKTGVFFERVIGTFWAKPLFLCPPCQSSVWGTIGFFLFVNLPFYYWPLYCICLCGLNFILVRITSNVIEIDDSND